MLGPDHARQYLQEHGDYGERDVEPDAVETGGMVDDSMSGNTIGGYKATISSKFTAFRACYSSLIFQRSLQTQGPPKPPRRRLATS